MLPPTNSFTFRRWREAVKLAYSALLVREYDEAIDWYTRVLGFRLAEDGDQGNDKRWIVIEAGDGGALLLAMARKQSELVAIGNQHGGRVAYFLEVGDFNVRYRSMSEHGVEFEGHPRNESYGTVVVFRDLYGNRWDLIERRAMIRPALKAVNGGNAFVSSMMGS